MGFNSAGASQTIRNKYKDTPIDLLSPTKPEDQEVREVLLEEKGQEELFDQGDLVGEDDLAGESRGTLFSLSLRLAMGRLLTVLSFVWE